MTERLIDTFTLVDDAGAEYTARQYREVRAAEGRYGEDVLALGRWRYELKDGRPLDTADEVNFVIRGTSTLLTPLPRPK